MTYLQERLTGVIAIVVVLVGAMFLSPVRATVRATGRDAFTVSGILYEFEGCIGYQRGWTVRLEPPGYSAVTDVMSGYFEFPDIPNGEYTIIAVPECNPFGCWPETPVAVSGGNEYVDICPVAFTPTPTATPTPSPTCTPVVCYLTRELPDHGCSGDEITINLNMYGDPSCYVVSIEETIPDGWEMLAPPWDDQIGNTYIWNEPIDSYNVRVGGAFLAEFSGSAVIWDPCQGNQTKPIEGDDSMWIPIDEFSWLSRTLPETGSPGELFTVTLSQEGGPAVIIQTSETLPEGWIVTEPDDFENDGNTFTWNRRVSEYTVLVPPETEPGDYTFSGTTLSSYTCPTEPVQYSIVGDSQITIVIPEPTPTPTPPCPDPVCLEFQMPDQMFGPGSVFYLDLHVINTGDYTENAMLFIALTVGTGDFWFYPDWVLFPPDIDWEMNDLPYALNDVWSILPEFSWPYGAGEFYGAMFLGAVMHEGELISNLAEITFGWTENL